MVIEPYYFRQNGSHSNPPHLNVFAFTWSLYFEELEESCVLRCLEDFKAA
jgi:hypothetical protein